MTGAWLCHGKAFTAIDPAQTYLDALPAPPSS
jgi:hypothetical protein